MSSVRDSVIWGAIVGVALGVTITFALARGLLPMPWRAELPPEAPRAVVLDLESFSTVAPTLPSDPSPEPRRPTRPGALEAAPSHGSLAAAMPATTTAERGLSRS